MKTVEILIEGVLGEEWSTTFDNFTIGEVSATQSLLKGSVRDQAQLRGILTRIADLGLNLVSVNVVSETAENL